VDTAFVLVDAAAPTGVFFREWLPDGTRRVYNYRAGSAAARLEPADLGPEAFAGARIVHLTGITPALSATYAAAVVRSIELACTAGAQVSFDPNYRARLWDESTAHATLLPLIAQTDILLMGHEDARTIFGTDDAAMAMKQASAMGVRLVVFKQAERGVSALFDAGFLAGLLRGNELEAALELGARLGAAAVGAMGGYAR
jgi:2-dehydro-3-deoxygluconokinase